MKITFSQIAAYLSLLATVLTAIAYALEGISPKYAAIALTASGVISAITTKVQGAPETKTVNQ